MNRPARFALKCEVVDGLAIIDGGELHHLREVMRLREGARVALLSSDHIEHIGRIEKFENDRAIVRIEKTIFPGEAHEVPPLILAAAIIKGPRMDFMVEKAAELGATELWPILCARGVAKMPGAARIERWRRLATSAAKQSLAASQLIVAEPITFTDLIHRFTKDNLATGASEAAMLKIVCTMGAEPMATVIRQHRGRGMVVACGPEGDFDHDELELARTAGFIAVGLGRNRLRSETAALAALSIAAAVRDELRAGE